ncbi:hypothetical protein T492DRAFT_957325 [Pavlovales sp. CCMP2436]|nr:hypothetical protein T492DRAFT_957325 [Pavlovales sp. CCMP2436]|mmetsp:Transcript_43217/g.101472  ORF Transcript_43217/g.101472 Transcript_43217/m.101472 type:complete len:355 (+) Transcript_43217:2-1066(+)
MVARVTTAGVFLGLIALASTMGSSTPARLGKKSTARDVVVASGGPGAFAGKTAVVTGGATGIGLETCKALALAGCRVIIASRDPKGYAPRCVAAIEKEGSYTVPGANLEHMFVDLSELTTVRELANALLAEPSIDFLVLNAGVMATPQRELTSSGFENQIAINHFSHQLLYGVLEPKLRAQPGGCRVVSLASTAHSMVNDIDLTDMHFAKRAYTPWSAYGQSKLANILFAKEVAERNRGTAVTALSVHPGVIKTPLWRNIPAAKSIGGFLVARFLADKSTEQGAATTVFACLSPECGRDDYAGVYLSDCAIALPASAARNSKLQAGLWSTTERQLAEAEASAVVGRKLAATVPL